MISSPPALDVMFVMFPYNHDGPAWAGEAKTINQIRNAADLASTLRTRSIFESPCPDIRLKLADQ